MSSIRDNLLLVANQIVDNEGFDKLTMRKLAQQAEVSIGSVYNAFESKDQLIMCIIENYWSTSIDNIVRNSNGNNLSFCDKLESFYLQFRKITKEFHQDWLKDLVKIQMTNPQVAQLSSEYKSDIEAYILQMILEDNHIKNQLDDSFTGEKLSTFIFEYMMILLREDSKSLGFLRIILDKIFN